MSIKGKFARRVIVGTVCLAVGRVGNAQSTVTLYGLVDGGILYTSKTRDPVSGKNGGKQWAFVDSGLSASQFGVAGVEDLGGGMTANFDLESGYSVATGGYNDSNGNQFGRQAWVSLKGDFGELKTGLQYSPFFMAIYESDARNFSQFGSGMVTYVNNVLATGIFNANAVSYNSPVIGGLRGSVMFALGGEPGNFQAGRQYSASIDYQVGGILVIASIYEGNAGGSAATPISTTQEFEGRTLGASYKFSKLTAKVSFVNYKVAGAFNNNIYSAGFDYQPLPQLDINGGVWITTDRNQTKNNSLMAALGTQYFLSKATTLYLQAGAANNRGAMNTGLSINGALNGASGTTFGTDFGIRHTF
ncbi:porin [Burkholderia pseudomallei]|uniref:porin n=1 Tax=Burkholderia pseudomallei TaxID=28450 RepID=UPI000538062D|nr:gram-negative porin family protein [Burkholderia pseudomallei MSHR2138]